MKRPRTAQTAGGMTPKGWSSMQAQDDIRTCSIDGCDKPIRARGWCSTHWARWYKNGGKGSPRPTHEKAACSVDGCTSNAIGRGWCEKHYRRWQKYGDPETLLRERTVHRYPDDALCKVAGCMARPTSKSYCQTHYERWKYTGDPGTADVRPNYRRCR